MNRKFWFEKPITKPPIQESSGRRIQTLMMIKGKARYGNGLSFDCIKIEFRLCFSLLIVIYEYVLNNSPISFPFFFFFILRLDDVQLYLLWFLLHWYVQLGQWNYLFSSPHLVIISKFSQIYLDNYTIYIYWSKELYYSLNFPRFFFSKSCSYNTVIILNLHFLTNLSLMCFNLFLQSSQSLHSSFWYVLF